MAASVVSVTCLKRNSNGQNSHTTIRANGPITAATSSALEQTFHNLMPGFRRIILDISSVDYIDGAGFGALASLYFHAKTAGCDLEIVNPRPHLTWPLRNWLHSVFAGHEEYLGMTPD
jgi:anti-anti-sigma factor